MSDVVLFLFFVVLPLIPLLYFLYLHIFDPWSYLKTQKKMHRFVGNCWYSTEQGGMAVNDEDWIMYFYKLSEED